MLNLASTLAVLSAIETLGADAAKYGPSIISFVQTSVAAVEQTGKPGAQKLAAVLAATETFVASLGVSALTEAWAGLSGEITTFVGDLVALYNEVGVFVKAVKGLVADIEAAIKGL